MKWNAKTKEVIQYVVSVVAFVFGLVLVAVSAFAVSPYGEVHSSIQMVFGVILTFVGAIFGLNLHWSNQVEAFKTETTSHIEKVIDERIKKNDAKEK